MRICILARKRLEFNTRVVRQARALSDHGHEVVVVSLRNPNPALISETPGVRYMEVAARTTMDKVHELALAVRLRLSGNRVPGGRDAASARAPAVEATPPCNAGWRIRLRASGRSAWRRLWSWLLPLVAARRTLRFATNAARALGNERFDYCQAHDSFALPAAMKLARRSGARIVYDAVEAPAERSGLALSATPRLLAGLERRRDTRIIHNAQTVVSIGDALAAWTAAAYGISTPVVVRNCSLYRNAPQDNRLRHDLGLGAEESIILLLGSIYLHQGVEQMIDAVALLPSAVHLVILGPVTQARYDAILRDRIEASPAAQRIHLLPPRPQEDVIDYASGADVGVVALQPVRLNHRVALPNKLFEYIMARLPVAVGRLPDVSAIVTDHDIGHVFDESNPADIAAKLAALLAPDAHMRYKGAVDRAAAVLCWEEEARKYVQIFR